MRGFAMMMTATLATTACVKQPDQLRVDGSWVRLGALPGRPAAAYFVIHGGPAPTRLINVSTDVAIGAQMHEAGPQMRPIDSIAIPADTAVEFKPSGRHVMLFDVNPGIKPGGRMTFTFSFADGTRLVQTAGVVGANDPEPS